MLRRSRKSLFALVGVLAVTAALVIHGFGVFNSLELKTVDARFNIRGTQGTPSDIVVVQIDDVTFNDLRNTDRPAQWPFKRRYHAKVIDQVAKGHPKAIAVDIQFTEPSDIKDDNALVTSVANAHHVVLSTTEVDKHGHTAIFGGDAVLKKIGARPGNGSVPTDSDGVMRRLPYDLNGLKSLGIVAAEVASGHSIGKPGSSHPWIDFAGPPGTVREYSYSRVMDGKVPPSVFRDKIVVIGPSAPTLQDIHATSASGSEGMSGAEIQANIANTALRDFPLRSVPGGVDLLLIILMGLLPPVVGLRFRGWHAPIVSLLGGALFTVAVQLAFDHGRVVTFVYPLFALALSTVTVLVVEYVREAFERARTRDVFSRFVPETVVQQVLARADAQLRLGGEQVYGTVMFTDLRGFTTFSENLSAVEVIDLLNSYLTEMSDAVLAHGGTLISYLGDGLMAIFGAPLPQEDHADRAVAAAREILVERLPKFNAWLHDQGFDRGFKMGIGINTGEFMAGNVGSERRLEYTAIGDTINTASRVEGMTKGTPYALFLAESTREALTQELEDLTFVDEMAVRGRSTAIRLWSLNHPAVLKQDWESEGGAKTPPPVEEPVVTEP